MTYRACSGWITDYIWFIICIVAIFRIARGVAQPCLLLQLFQLLCQSFEARDGHRPLQMTGEIERSLWSFETFSEGKLKLNNN